MGDKIYKFAPIFLIGSIASAVMTVISAINSNGFISSIYGVLTVVFFAFWVLISDVDYISNDYIKRDKMTSEIMKITKPYEDKIKMLQQENVLIKKQIKALEEKINNLENKD